MFEYICLLFENFDTSFFASMLWCASSPFLYIVTRATSGERKPNGSLPKLRGVPYKTWGNKIKLIPPDSTTRKELMEPCCNTHLVQHLKHWLLPSYVCWQHWMIDFDIDQLRYWKWLISTIIYMDNGHWRNGWYGQWISKMFGQWTLKNMLNIGDAHTRISTIVPDTYPWHLPRVPNWTVFQSCLLYTSPSPRD